MTRASTPLRTVHRYSFVVTLLVAACGGSDGGTSLPKPAAVQSAGDAGASATVGTALTSAPTFIVTDASGNALGNIAVSVTVASGGGTLVGAPTRTAAGPTSVGTWTLGTTAGTNTLTVTVSGLSPLTISATGTPGSAAKIVVTGGNTQTGLAGAQLATPLAAAVQDQFGNGIANQQVTFQVTAGGGSMTPAQVTTNASGVASGAVWRLGNRGGTQAAAATANGFTTAFSATIQSSYPLTLRFYGTPMSSAAQTAFNSAADRIRAAVIAPLSSLNLTGLNLAACQDSTTGAFAGLIGTLNESTTGVLIYATTRAIDGPGGVLGQAGPCWIRGSNNLTGVGAMEFDDADVQNYINTGRFESLVLHEMNHVLGFGTIWDQPAIALLRNPAYRFDENQKAWVLTGSTDPRFTGSAGITNCISAGGSTNHCSLGTGVAVEYCGLAGTADGHWRKWFGASCTRTNRGPEGGTAAFGTELMTGYASSTMQWSAMSIASLQDLGYTVNLLAADPFTMPSLLALARMSLMESSTEQAREVLVRPRFRILSDGSVQRIKREVP